MSAYREIGLAPGAPTTTLLLDTVRVPVTSLALSLTVLGGAYVALHAVTLGAIIAIACGLVLFALPRITRRPSTMVFHAEADALEIHRGSAVERVRLSAVEQVVFERTPLSIRVFVQTKSGEETLVWSGLSLFAGSVPRRVRDAIVESLERVESSP